MNNSNMNDYPKCLIKVDLPIKRISEHARREKSIRHGHISTLHLVGAATAPRRRQDRDRDALYRGQGARGCGRGGAVVE